jgi:hypothetical protein
VPGHLLCLARIVATLYAARQNFPRQRIPIVNQKAGYHMCNASLGKAQLGIEPTTSSMPFDVDWKIRRLTIPGGPSFAFLPPAWQKVYNPVCAFAMRVVFVILLLTTLTLTAFGPLDPRWGAAGCRDWSPVGRAGRFGVSTSPSLKVRTRYLAN